MTKRYFPAWGILCWLGLSFLISILVNPKSPELFKACWNRGVWLSMCPVAMFSVYLYQRFRGQIQRVLHDKVVIYLSNAWIWGLLAWYLWYPRVQHSIGALCMMSLFIFFSFGAGMRAARTVRNRIRHQEDDASW